MRLFYTLFLALLLSGLVLESAEETSAQADKLVIGTKVAPPFAFKDNSGQWRGISIELWKGIAKDQGLEYEIKEYDLTDLLAAVASGEVDVAASALTVTAERAKKMDFSPTYYGTGLGIATSFQKQDIWSSLANRLFTWTFFKAVLALIAVLAAAGVGIWFFERKRNPEHFGGKPQHGLGNGFWWSAVTMTTVGYGDKAPVTIGGRVIGLIWMFTSIIIISGFTGAIATALTVGQLEPVVQGPQDLPRVTVGALDKSAAQLYLENEGVRARSYDSVKQGLQDVKDGKIQAFVNDHPILVYQVSKDFPGSVDVLPHSFDPGYIALAYPRNSPNQRQFDLSLLEFIQTPAWDAIIQKYIGENE